MERRSVTNRGASDFEATLVARIAELENVLRRRDLIALEHSADQLDEVQRASDGALAISDLDRESQHLSEARRALRRIHEGRFGVCEECGEGVHPKRPVARANRAAQD